MKENLENKIKQSLENHEMPYNASAWTAMQAKLDIVKPVTSPVSYLKWYISAASVVVVGIVTYVSLNSTNEPIKEKLKKAENTELIESNSNSTNRIKNTTQDNLTPTPAAVSSNEAAIDNSNANKVDNSASHNTSHSNPFLMSSGSGDREAIGSGNGSVGNDTSNGNSSGNNSTTTTTNSTENYILPNITEVCEGESTTIKNMNDVVLMIQGPSMQYVIPANSERKVRMTKEGTHEISVMVDGNSKKSSTFFVKGAPKADFIIDTDTKFEKGLPTTKLETSVPGVEHSWIIGTSRVYGEKVDAHFYNSGNKDVTLTVKDANGCSSSITKSIRIDEKYNLMAVNSFIPEDIDDRNNTFMPFALTQRNVKFNLIIIDPTDGHIVFQSNDATNAWNGIDKSTGNGVNYGMTYIWKVIIENAEPNENNEYAGNITPIQKR